MKLSKKNHYSLWLLHILRTSKITYNSSFNVWYSLQELTEEGLPFLILFHHPDDTETPEKYKKVVARELIGEKSKFEIFTVTPGKIL